MNRLTLKSYAKVNLALDVLGLRNDGYHELDSVVQVIDLADVLELETAPCGVIEVVSNVPWLPNDSRNLVWRTGEALISSAGVHSGFRCRLTKNIPARSGLGGGSGNAAATAVALNKLFGTGLDPEELARTVSEISSDAALFIAGGTVRMRGRGDLVEPLPDAPCLNLVVVKPNEGVSTPEAYRLLDDSKNVRWGGADLVASAIAAHDASRLCGAMWNDFDPVVSERFPSIKRAKWALIAAGAKAAMVTGSGSAVFGVCDSEADAHKIAQKIGGSVGLVFVTHSLTRAESCLGEVAVGES